MRKGLLKKYQKQLTKLLREANKYLRDDEWFHGRFYVMQRKADLYKFEDGSGGVMYVEFRMYDKKTGYYHDYRMDYAPYLSGNRWHLYVDVMNKFLTEDFVYSPKTEDAEDYYDVPYIQNDTRISNYYMPYKIWKERCNDGCD